MVFIQFSEEDLVHLIHEFVTEVYFSLGDICLNRSHIFIKNGMGNH